MSDSYLGWGLIWEGGVAAPEYLQMTREEAELRAAANGVVLVRVVDGDKEGVNITSDRRTDRLSLLVHDGCVALSAFF
jgi:hypothetical protein